MKFSQYVDQISLNSVSLKIDFCAILVHKVIETSMTQSNEDFTKKFFMFLSDLVANMFYCFKSIMQAVYYLSLMKFLYFRSIKF